ncbi:hypothetical protein P43SY_005899 [Pythium insidiosum]|uniref:Uncharacterized protein n=1 Tax=Pythium insidiosum TaxID=114742 RepID=A0AAD5L9A6_PYTIN|nr:hypothetical protein P43SY_005899 [Pythium insidiosum]
MAPGEDGDFDEDEHIDHLVPLPVSAARGRVQEGNVSEAQVRSESQSRPSRCSGSGRARSRKQSSSGGSVGVTSIVSGSSRSETQQYQRNGLCGCRKLGQRLEQPKDASVARRLFRKNRDTNNKQSSDVNLLTARLLSAESRSHKTRRTVPSRGVMLQDFEDFDGAHDDNSFVRLTEESSVRIDHQLFDYDAARMA